MKKRMKGLLKKILLSIPILNSKVNRYDYLNKLVLDAGFEPGHFYSPVPNLYEIIEKQNVLFQDKDICSINMNEQYQRELLLKLKQFYADYLYHRENSDQLDYRYKKEGAFYRHSDSVFLYSMIRHYKPKRIIEVGSGHSSAIMLDTNEYFLNKQVEHTFIEPYTQRLEDILKDTDYEKNKIIKSDVQSVELTLFETLEENDILFIDSTHVSKIGSDVNYLLFEVIPRLKPGVLIHFHDIFYNFEYPKKWILQNRYFWNEIYLVRAFLMNNNNYQIELFNSYLHHINRPWFEKEMPECLKGFERGIGSIWIKKTI